MKKKKENKALEISKAKENNDENMRQKLQELKEKERKFEERLKLHKEQVKQQQKDRHDYEEMRKMSLKLK